MLIVIILAVLLIFHVMGASPGAAGDKKATRFKVGDHVRVKWRGQEGVIIDASNGFYMVSMSGGRTVESYTASDLEKTW
ncbi:MAG: hypothetical protein II149_01510 [Clostridia bacterium]|nr:hypothetical protein [Clostridia bacterium]